MTRYAVQIAYDASFARTVAVDAATPEEACAAALRHAEEEEDACWRGTDWVGPTYVDAVAEGEEPWDALRAHPVPTRLSQMGVAFPRALDLILLVGRLLESEPGADPRRLLDELRHAWLGVIGQVSPHPSDPATKGDAA